MSSHAPVRCCTALATKTLAAASVFFLLWEVPLGAYLDPGSGSMLVQLLLGGVAGIAVTLRLGWRRLRDRFNLRDSRRQPSQNGE